MLRNQSDSPRHGPTRIKDFFVWPHYTPATVTAPDLAFESAPLTRFLNARLPQQRRPGHGSQTSRFTGFRTRVFNRDESTQVILVRSEQAGSEGLLSLPGSHRVCSARKPSHPASGVAAITHSFRGTALAAASESDSESPPILPPLAVRMRIE